MSHSVEIGIRYSSVAPAIDMEHDKIGKTKIAGFCFVEMNVKLKKIKDTPLLQHRMSAFDT